jgi:hypothetical protein
MIRGPGLWRRAFPPVGAVVLLGVSVLVAFHVAQPSGGQVSENVPPPPDGYFQLPPVGSYKSLPSDAAAAAKVDRSAWDHAAAIRGTTTQFLLICGFGWRTTPTMPTTRAGTSTSSAVLLATSRAPLTRFFSGLP